MLNYRDIFLGHEENPKKLVRYFIRTFLTRGREITLLRAAVASDDSMVLELER